jgi:hypothetical protein
VAVPVEQQERGYSSDSVQLGQFSPDGRLLPGYDQPGHGFNISCVRFSTPEKMTMTIMFRKYFFNLKDGATPLLKKGVFF